MIASLISAIVFASVLFQIGFLIRGVLILSGMIVGAVTKAVFTRTSDYAR